MTAAGMLGGMKQSADKMERYPTFAYGKLHTNHVQQQMLLESSM